MSRKPRFQCELERILRSRAPELFETGVDSIDPLDLSIILLNAIQRGIATETALANYCRGGDGLRGQLPTSFGPVLKELIDEGFLTETIVECAEGGSGVERKFSLTDFGRSSISVA